MRRTGPGGSLRREKILRRKAHVTVYESRDLRALRKCHVFSMLQWKNHSPGMEFALALLLAAQPGLLVVSQPDGSSGYAQFAIAPQMSFSRGLGDHADGRLAFRDPRVSADHHVFAHLTSHFVARAGTGTSNCLCDF